MCLVHLLWVLFCRCALVVLLFFEGRRPGWRPGRRLTFFVSPKKVSKERRPDVHALLRRVRCAAQLGRGLAKLAALRQTRALFPPKSALLAVPDGRWGAGADGCCCAAAPLCFNQKARLLRSAGAHWRSALHNQHRYTSAAGCTGSTDFVSAFASSPAPDCPVGQGRAAQCQGDQAPRLFERSEFSGAPPGASSAGNHEVALTSGRLSFGYFALAKQRKVPRPPGRPPGLRPQTKSRSHRAQRQGKAFNPWTRQTIHCAPRQTSSVAKPHHPKLLNKLANSTADLTFILSNTRDRCTSTVRTLMSS